MADEIMAEGVRLFPKHDKAPDFVLGTLIITPNDLFTWMKANDQYTTEYEGKKQLKLQLKKSKAGKLYASVDTWKPEPKNTPSEGSGIGDDPGSLPF